MGRLASVLFSEPDLELLELLARLRPLAARKLMLLRLIDMIDAQQRGGNDCLACPAAHILSE